MGAGTAIFLTGLMTYGFIAMRRRTAAYDRKRRFSERVADAQYRPRGALFRD